MLVLLLSFKVQINQAIESFAPDPELVVFFLPIEFLRAMMNAMSKLVENHSRSRMWKKRMKNAQKQLNFHIAFKESPRSLLLSRAWYGAVFLSKTDVKSLLRSAFVDFLVEDADVPPCQLHAEELRDMEFLGSLIVVIFLHIDLQVFLVDLEWCALPSRHSFYANWRVDCIVFCFCALCENF